MRYANCVLCGHEAHLVQVDQVQCSFCSHVSRVEPELLKYECDDCDGDGCTTCSHTGYVEESACDFIDRLLAVMVDPDHRILAGFLMSLLEQDKTDTQRAVLRARVQIIAERLQRMAPEIVL